ncbi:MAG TPA: DNA mismatch repair endonuclease MutH [Polyangiaceae bacterium]
MPVDPPRTEDELAQRAKALVGVTIGDLAARVGLAADGSALRTKGRPGEIVERALGATGGNAKVHDFPDLAIELKTIPVTPNGVPVESTYVCTLALADADSQEWDSSWVRSKLARVLFVPTIGDGDAAWHERRIGTPMLWSPTAAQESILRGDFEDVVGLVGVGRIEELTAHLGRWLQVRPKAANGSVRTTAYGADHEEIRTVPRGFYLRTRFTGAILLDPAAEPD